MHSAGTGYLKLDDMRRILNNLGLGLSHRTVKELCLQVMDPASRKIVYRELYEKEIKE